MTASRRAITIVAPSGGETLASAWRDGTFACTTEFVVLGVSASAQDAVIVQQLLSARDRADAVLGVAGVLPVALLLRARDVPALSLLRLRGDGSEMATLLARLTESGRRVVRVALTRPREATHHVPSARRRLVRSAAAEQLVAMGFEAKLCSRPNHNLEIWERRAARTGRPAVVACPLCGAAADTQRPLPLFTSADVRDRGEACAVLCPRCAVAYTDPLPAAPARVIAPDIEHHTMGVVQQRLLRRFLRQRVERVRPLLPPDRRPVVADIGGGACAFANALAATGCDVTVFEPNAANAAAANRAAGVRFVASPFDAQAADAAGIAAGSLDAVTLWHAFEHVPDPAATLTLIRRLLRPGGIVYVSVPNLDALQADVAGTRWCYADIPRHVTHFSPEGLERLLRRHGFGACTPYWWSEEYEIFGWYQSLLNMLTGSHNYFYNRAKKGRLADAGPHPRWTRMVTAAGPLLLPVAVAAAWVSSAAAKPSCVEMHGVAQ